MHRIRIAALSAALLVSGSAIVVAQAPQGRGNGDRQGQFERRGGKGEKGGRGFRGALRGLKLSDSQKSQVKAIGDKYQPQFKQLAEQARPSMEAARAARQKGDTLEARRQFEAGRAVMQKGEAIRTQEVAEVRSILTADQQKTLDANIAQMKERRANGDDRGFGRGEKNEGKESKGKHKNGR